MIRPGIRRLFRLPGRPPAEVDDEMRLHLELRAEQLEREGLEPEAARAEARRRFGDLEAARRMMRGEARHAHRRLRASEWAGALLDDARHAARALAREPGLTALVAVMLALGIGVNAAMFGVIDRLLLRGPAAVHEPGRLRRLYMTARVPGIGEFTGSTLGWVWYDRVRGAVPALEGVAASSVTEATFGERQEARQVRMGAATADFFPLLGVRPALGRFYGAWEDRPPVGARVVVLGDAFWRRELGGDAGAVGREVTLNGERFQVIGVAPPGFTGTTLEPVDLWIPMSTRSARMTPAWPRDWSAQWLQVVARLRPGATDAQAGAQLTALLRRTYDGDEIPVRTAVYSLRPLGSDDDGREAAQTVIARWLMGVAAVVLLIVCANVANLTLARAVRQRRELAVRLALGISRGRLVRLLLLESVARVALGALAGVVAAWWLGRLVRGTLLPDVAWLGPPVDARVLTFTIAAALGVAALTALAPLGFARRTGAADALRGGAQGGGGRRARARTALVLAQTALSVALLVGAGLFVRSLQRVGKVPLGLEPERVLAADIDWPSMGAIADSARALERARRDRAIDGVLAGLRARPDVDDAAIAIGTPFHSRFGVPIRADGWDSLPRLPGGGPYVSAVTGGYFATVGTRLLRGRAFSDADRDGARVAIVNRTMARVLWPGRDALGQCLYLGPRDAPCARVVGVAEDAHREGLRDRDAMQVYLPVGQERGMGGRMVLVRPRGDPAAAAPTVRRALTDALPGVLLVSVATLQDALDPEIRPWRTGALLFGLFGALALLVAALGLYSVVTYTVAQRRHEFGVRAALGALPRDVLALVMRQGLATALAGCAAGLLLALAAGRFLAPLLFETSPRDPLVLAVVAAAMVGTALIASIAPARRAARVDPALALRAD